MVMCPQAHRDICPWQAPATRHTPSSWGGLGDGRVLQKDRPSAELGKSGSPVAAGGGRSGGWGAEHQPGQQSQPWPLEPGGGAGTANEFQEVSCEGPENP